MHIKFKKKHATRTLTGESAPARYCHPYAVLALTAADCLQCSAGKYDTAVVNYCTGSPAPVIMSWVRVRDRVGLGLM